MRSMALMGQGRLQIGVGETLKQLAYGNCQISEILKSLERFLNNCTDPTTGPRLRNVTNHMQVHSCVKHGKRIIVPNEHIDPRIKRN